MKIKYNKRWIVLCLLIITLISISLNSYALSFEEMKEEAQNFVMDENIKDIHAENSTECMVIDEEDVIIHTIIIPTIRTVIYIGITVIVLWMVIKKIYKKKDKKV